jgi:streptomycin 6-kinase
MKFSFSNMFEHTIKTIYGIDGSTWLGQLPKIIKACSEKWHLKELTPYQNLTYNYVLSGFLNEQPIVLKLRCRTQELKRELATLTQFLGFGCVRVLASDEHLGALLLERVVPGYALSKLFPHKDSVATTIAADLLSSLYGASITKEFPSLEHILPDLQSEPYALTSFLPYARKSIKKLLSSQNRVLLHGDFHHGNIICAGSEQWVMIDPEGIVGDPAYDLAVYIRNPVKELVAAPNAKEIITNRIHDFSKLFSYSPQSIYDWTYVQVTVSAYWSIEDGIDIRAYA